MSKLSKFKIGDDARVIMNMHAAFDKVGVVVGHVEPRQWMVHYQPEVLIQFPNGHKPLPTQERHLTLADPDVHTVLDQMDAESKVMPTDQMPWAKKRKQILDAAEKGCDFEVKSEGAAERTGITASDKLRMIADTVEGQSPFGTELANFRRRLFAILSIGHDA